MTASEWPVTAWHLLLKFYVLVATYTARKQRQQLWLQKQNVAVFYYLQGHKVQRRLHYRPWNPLLDIHVSRGCSKLGATQQGQEYQFYTLSHLNYSSDCIISARNRTLFQEHYHRYITTHCLAPYRFELQLMQHLTYTFKEAILLPSAIICTSRQVGFTSEKPM